MTGSDRIRHRQGKVRIVNGVPYPNRETTLSLLPGAATGRWLADHRQHIGGRLLDAGCGNQPFRPWYEPLVDSVVAVDAGPIEGITVLGYAHQLPFADSSFDTILLTSVLEHVPDAETATMHLARVLKPGGHLIMTVPFMYPTHEPPYDFFRFTHYGLRELLERHGLEVITLDAQGGAVLLTVHFAVLSVVGALKAAAARLGPVGWLVDNRLVRALVWAPQELVRRLPGTRLRGTAKRASLGYMAVARKPVPLVRAGTIPEVAGATVG